MPICGCCGMEISYLEYTSKADDKTKICYLCGGREMMIECSCFDFIDRVDDNFIKHMIKNLERISDKQQEELFKQFLLKMITKLNVALKDREKLKDRSPVKTESYFDLKN